MHSEKGSFPNVRCERARASTSGSIDWHLIYGCLLCGSVYGRTCERVLAPVNRNWTRDERGERSDERMLLQLAGTKGRGGGGGIAVAVHPVVFVCVCQCAAAALISAFNTHSAFHDWDGLGPVS